MNQVPQNLLSEILQKPKKSLEDAHVIYEKIRNFRFFENFFAQNLRAMDFPNLLSLCQGFEYERVPYKKFVFRKGDASNNKFYVIISGKVAIVAPKADTKTPPIPIQQSYKVASDPKSTTGIESVSPTSANRHMSNFSGFRRTLIPRSMSPKKLTTQLSNYNHNMLPARKSVLNSPKKTSLKNQKTMWGPLSLLYSKDANSSSHQLSPKKNSTKLANSQSFSSLMDAEKQSTPRDWVEEDSVIEMSDNRPFGQFLADIGSLIRYMDAGEGFGELALKNNAPRSASVVCSADCEFLIITKKQFKHLFLEKEHEKEQFLRETFPFLNSISTISFNYILFSFKTEVYNKGTYLTVEGKVNNPKKSKLFLIFRGECLIEKNISIQVNHPLNKSQPFVQNTESLQLSVIGPGMIAGEEIILADNSYNYSIKALSESVIVHSVTKAELETIFFKEFQKNIIKMYEKKKMQREITFENLKKDYDQKAAQMKSKNIYSFQNMKMGAITNKSAIESLSRRINREQQIVDSKETPRQSGKSESVPPKKPAEEETTGSIGERPQKKQMLLNFYNQESARNSESNIDLPNRMGVVVKTIEPASANNSTSKDIETMKLFEPGASKLSKKNLRSSSFKVPRPAKQSLEGSDATAIDEVIVSNIKKNLMKSKKLVMMNQTFQGFKINCELPLIKEPSNMENMHTLKTFDSKQISRIPSEAASNQNEISLMQIKSSPKITSSQKTFSRKIDKLFQSQTNFKVGECNPLLNHFVSPIQTGKASMFNFEDQSKTRQLKNEWAIDNLSPIKISDVVSLKAKDYMLPKNKIFSFPSSTAEINQQPFQSQSPPDDDLLKVKSPNTSSSVLKAGLLGHQNEHNMRLKQSKNWRSRIFKNTHAHKFSLDHSVTKLSFSESSMQNLKVGN